MKKKQVFVALAVSMLTAVCCGGNSLAVETDLDEVIVEGNREPSEKATLPGGFILKRPAVGLMGNRDVMDTPFAVTAVSQKTIKTFASPYNGINEALAFDPSVRIISGALYQDISIRGFGTNGHRQYVNGIPGLLNQENIPYYWVDHVSIISGPNLGVNGSTLSEAVGGAVNYASKRAETDSAEVKLAYRGGSSFEEGVDLQTRFGDKKRYGVRVTANTIQGETVIDHEKLEQQNVFINLDQKTEWSKTNLLVGYNHTKHKAGPYSFSFQFGENSLTGLPDAPDATRNYKPSWSYNEYDNWIAALNHEQKLSDHVTAFFNAGYHREDWYGYIDGSPKIIRDNGDFTISLSNYPLALTKKYAGLGIKGDFTIGKVKNDYIIGVDKNWQNYDISNNPHFKWSGTGNIYQDNSWANPGIAHWKPGHSDDTQLTGWHIIDTMKALDDKLQITVGVHGHKAVVNKADGSENKSDAVSPTYAVSYQFTPDVMMYADHTESFGMGARVSTDPTMNYINAGEMLDPSKTKQNEIGVKVKTGNFWNTFSYFDIKQANAIDVQRSDGLYRDIDGEQENKGFEWGFTGNIHQKWDLIGGLMYIDVKQSKTQGGLNDGKAVDGMPHWSGTLGAIYHPNDRISLIGRGTYLGSSSINGGTIDVPSSFVFDLGASFDTTIGGTPVTIDAMCYNVAGKDYWIARGSSTSLALGAPRTFILSANFRM